MTFLKFLGVVYILQTAPSVVRSLISAPAPRNRHSCFEPLHFSTTTTTTAFVRNPSHVAAFDARSVSKGKRLPARFVTSTALQEHRDPSVPTSAKLTPEKKRVLKNLFFASNSMMELTLLGRGTVAISENTTSACLFLTTPETLSLWNDKKDDDNGEDLVMQALAIPLTSPERILPLLESSVRNEPMSKVRCLSLNSRLVNRDDGLYDNLPWSQWSVTNTKRGGGRDLDSNIKSRPQTVEDKYHLTKRDAFDRFLGKDWPGRSLSIGNLVQKAIYELYPAEAETEEVEWDAEGLAARILKLELMEARSELAGAEEDRARFLLSREDGEVFSDSAALEECEQRVKRIKLELDRPSPSSSLVDTLKRVWSQASPTSTVAGMRTLTEELTEEAKSFILSSLESIVRSFEGDNPAPYRGAYGYTPFIDSADDQYRRTYLPYTGPYDLMHEIVGDALQAQLYGAVLEDTWIADERQILLGGACVLKRNEDKSRKVLVLEGEEIDIPVTDEETEGEDVRPGDLYVVECNIDEALGMSLARNMNVIIDKGIWEDLRITVNYIQSNQEPVQNDNYHLPIMDIIQDKSTTFRIDRPNYDDKEDNDTDPASTPSINGPKTTASLFSASPSSSTNDQNPIQSLQTYDSLSVPEKAKILLSLDSFTEKLPRPRVVLQAAKDEPEPSSTSPLDKFLIPLMDESVRGAILIREAELAGDTETVRELTEQMSKRQMAKEMSQKAQKEGEDGLSDGWEGEADFYGELRADVTQDEGSYSRFLDKDEWYERDRVNRAKKLKKNKNKFGTLLDGIE